MSISIINLFFNTQCNAEGPNFEEFLEYKFVCPHLMVNITLIVISEKSGVHRIILLLFCKHGIILSWTPSLFGKHDINFWWTPHFFCQSDWGFCSLSIGEDERICTQIFGGPRRLSLILSGARLDLTSAITPLEPIYKVMDSDLKWAPLVTSTIDHSGGSRKFEQDVQGFP